MENERKRVRASMGNACHQAEPFGAKTLVSHGHLECFYMQIPEDVSTFLQTQRIPECQACYWSCRSSLIASTR
eukprot:1158393-Pelagomonas_calceolata.AAC.1